MSEPIPIASFDHLPPAQTLARELSAKGFEAGILNETAEQALKFFTATPRGQFRVTVPPDRMEDALKTFAALEPLPPERARECPLREVIRCPDCGSTIVEYPQFSRNTIEAAFGVEPTSRRLCGPAGGRSITHSPPGLSRLDVGSTPKAA